MKRPAAVRKSVPRETAMAIIVVRESVAEVAEEEVLLVALEGAVMSMAVVEKRDPVMLRRVPGAGSCLQPASRARRTMAVSQYIIQMI